MSHPAPDFEATLEFLARLRPAGPVNLNAKAVIDVVFASATDEGVRQWLQQHAAENLYFMPNPRAAGRKRGEDVDYACCAHRDIDCDKWHGTEWAGAPLQDRKAEALRYLLSDEVKEHAPGPPTLVVDTGGGLHAYWFFASSVSGYEAERANIYLRDHVFPDRDGTWDATRLLRLPGTVNQLSPDKIARGRVPALVKVVHEDWERRYDYWEFNTSELPIASETADVFIGAFEDVDDAEMSALVDTHSIPEATLQLIEQGAGAKDDASSVLHSVMKTLIRRGVPLEKIGGIFMGDWAIADSTVRHKDHGSEDDEGYVRRQIRRAYSKVHKHRELDFPDTDETVAAYDREPAGKDDEDGVAGLSYQLASDVEPKPLSPLWPGRIFIGKLTTLAGMPDQGKSVVSCDIAARVSRGDDWPDGRGTAPAGHVIILSAEDDPEDTITPRLMAAGAVLDRVIILNSLVVSKGGKRMFNIGNDIPRLDALVKRFPDTRALILDPANAYMGTSKENDSFRDSDVRAVLSPLKEWAERNKIAVIIITHFKKGGTGRAIDQVMGSLAFTALSRSAWAFIEEKDQEDQPTGRKLMAKIKQNITEPVDAVAYSLVGVEVAPGISAPRVQWGGVVKGNADDLMHAPKVRPAEKLMLAVSFLRSELAEGPVPASTIRREARAAGFAEKTVNRAKEEIGAVSERTAEGWVWRLSTPADDFPDDQDGHDGN